MEVPSPLGCLLMAVFRVAWASRLCVFLLATLVRGPAFIHLEPGNMAVSLATHPLFPGEKEVRHRLSPVSLPAWSVVIVPHALCPVAALCAFLDTSSGVQSLALWVRPGSERPIASEGAGQNSEGRHSGG